MFDMSNTNKAVNVEEELLKTSESGKLDKLVGEGGAQQISQFVMGIADMLNTVSDEAKEDDADPNSVESRDQKSQKDKVLAEVSQEPEKNKIGNKKKDMKQNKVEEERQREEERRKREKQRKLVETRKKVDFVQLFESKKYFFIIFNILKC